MTLQQLEHRLESLERQFEQWKAEIGGDPSKGKWRQTFGMFADDPEFDEVLRLGREYRDEANQERE